MWGGEACLRRRHEQEDGNDQHEWPWSARSGVGLMAGFERDAVGQAPAGTDRPTHRTLAEGSVGGGEATSAPAGRLGRQRPYLGVSRATIERLVLRGELPIVKVAGSTRYDVEDLNGYIVVNRCRNRKRTA